MTKQKVKSRLFSIAFGDKHLRSKIYYHWNIILAVFIGLNLLLLVFSWYLFLQINEGGIFLVEKENTVQIDTIDRNMLNELIKSFDEKKVIFEGRTVSAPRLSDPSL